MKALAEYLHSLPSKMLIMSAIHMLKRIDPIEETCGTPKLVHEILEMLESICIKCSLFVK